VEEVLAVVVMGLDIAAVATWEVVAVVLLATGADASEVGARGAGGREVEAQVEVATGGAVLEAAVRVLGLPAEVAMVVLAAEEREQAVAPQVVVASAVKEELAVVEEASVAHLPGGQVGTQAEARPAEVAAKVPAAAALDWVVTVLAHQGVVV
jgi:hypothetical protein